MAALKPQPAQRKRGTDPTNAAGTGGRAQRQNQPDRYGGTDAQRGAKPDPPMRELNPATSPAAATDHPTPARWQVPAGDEYHHHCRHSDGGSGSDRDDA